MPSHIWSGFLDSLFFYCAFVFGIRRIVDLRGKAAAAAVTVVHVVSLRLVVSLIMCFEFVSKLMAAPLRSL